MRTGFRSKARPETAISEVEESQDTLVPSTGNTRRPARRNRGNLTKGLPRIEHVIEPESLQCPRCQKLGGCGEMHKIGEDRTERLDIVPAQLCGLNEPAPRDLRKFLA